MLMVFLFLMMKNKLCKILDINVDYKQLQGNLLT